MRKNRSQVISEITPMLKSLDVQEHAVCRVFTNQSG
jgi:hypothetical protein